jgi:hypothetical protein
MKTRSFARIKLQRNSTASIAAVCVALNGLLLINAAHAQIYVGNGGNDTIGEYNLDGTPINPSLISLAAGPSSIAISGTNLFVGESNGATEWIAEYNVDGTAENPVLVTGPAGDAILAIAVFGNDLIFSNNTQGAGMSISECTTSGTLLTTSLVPSLGPNGEGFGDGMAVSGTNLFVSVGGNGNNQIAEYTTSGVLLNNSLIPGVGTSGFALSGSNIFVSDASSNDIGEYTTSGGTVNTNIDATTSNAFVSPEAMAAFGAELYIVDDGSIVNDYNNIGEYSLDGTTFNGELLTDADLHSADCIAVIPEPSPWAMLAAGMGGIIAFRKRRRS